MKYLEEYLQSQLFLSKEIKILLSFGEENNELQAGVGLGVGARYPTLIWVKSSNRVGRILGSPSVFRDLE